MLGSIVAVQTRRGINNHGAVFGLPGVSRSRRLRYPRPRHLRRLEAFDYSRPSVWSRGATSSTSAQGLHRIAPSSTPASPRSTAVAAGPLHRPPSRVSRVLQLARRFDVRAGRPAPHPRRGLRRSDDHRLREQRHRRYGRHRRRTTRRRTPSAAASRAVTVERSSGRGRRPSHAPPR